MSETMITLESPSPTNEFTHDVRTDARVVGVGVRRRPAALPVDVGFNPEVHREHPVVEVSAMRTPAGASKTTD